MSDDAISPAVGLALGATVAGLGTAIAGAALETTLAIAVGLGVAMPLLVVYGYGGTFDRAQYVADHSAAALAIDAGLIAAAATIAGVAGAVVARSVADGPAIGVALAAGLAFLGGAGALYARRPGYHGLADR